MCDDTTTVVTITKLPARVARGAYKPKSSGSCGAAQSTKTIYASADRRVLLNRAAKGKHHVKP
jgi:hypothetical protein